MSRILMVNYEYPPLGGGGGVLCRDVAEEFVSRGAAVTVITSGYGGLPARESSNGVDIHRVPVLGRTGRDTATILSMLTYCPMAIRHTLQLARARQFDLVNTFFAIPSGPVGDSVARRLGIPNVLSLMGGDIYDPSKWLSPHVMPGLRQTVRAMLRRADRVIACSSDTRNGAEKYYGTTRPIEVVPLGIRAFDCPPRDRAALDLPDDALVLCTIGRLVRRKDIPALVRILARTADSRDVRLVVIGDGPERSRIENAVRSAGLTGKVHLPGRVDEERKRQYLAASDIYASTSMHEGFGLVFLEAMQCGLPVICYDRGGQGDFLVDGRSGYLVPHGDESRFRERLGALLGDAQARQTMGAFNRERASGFHIENSCRRYEEIFSEAMQSRRHHPAN